ncbi:MAG: hypothetical protein GX558_11730, partial [Clostridiales bacterium]|nr:hypothetical protein [Clostridiales bacterium]
GMDAWGEFFLVYDLESGECEKGVCLFGEAQDQVMLSFDAGMVFQMDMDFAGDLMTLTDRETGQMWTLERFRLEVK